MGGEEDYPPLFPEIIESFFERSEAESPGWGGLKITPGFNPGNEIRY